MLSHLKKELLPSEKQTFYIHFLYSLIEGIILGVLALNEFVFLKSLGGSDTGVSILFQTSVFVLTFSVLLNEWTRRIKNIKKFLFILGLITRLPLFLLLFFPSELYQQENQYVYHYIFLVIFLIYYFANPIIYPVINQLLKANYTQKNFSVLYSWSTTANKIIMLLVTFAFGRLLDHNIDVYRYAYPIISVLGVLSLWLLSRINYENVPVERKNLSLWQSVRSTINQMKLKMISNKPFRDFEVSFMFYGFAFMGTVSVIAIFFQKSLELNYTSVAFYKNSYNILAILLLPLFGKQMSRMDPRRFAAITFSSLLFYLLFIGLTSYFPYHYWFDDIKIYATLMLAMFFNGIFAATMSLLWSIGSSFFSPKEEVSEYQAIHLTFTGFRSFFAPILGLGIYILVGFTATFITGIVLLLIAVLVSLKSYRKYHLNGVSKDIKLSTPEPPAI